MQIRRKLFAAILIPVLLLNMAGVVLADSTQENDACIGQMLNYYRYHQDAAATDIECLLYQLSQDNPYKAQDWASIMEYWSYVNTALTIYPNVLPDGLPQDNTLCIVVMGYALDADGSMKRELVSRLETALASAQKYPNAYIACTGGGTAQNNKTRTEAGEMSKWLIAQGIDEKRIIVEDQSLSTVSNAINTCRILAKEYPLVTHLAIVTSDYHLARSCLLFHAQATLSASKGAPLLCVAANAAYVTSAKTESVQVQADNLAQLTGISIGGLAKPKLSRLDRITVWDDTEYIPGVQPQLQVIAYYDTGLYRDVSKYAQHTAIDWEKGGQQELTVTYTEGETTVSSMLSVDVPVPETEAAPTATSTETPQPEPATLPPETLPAAVDTSPPDSSWPIWILTVCAALLAALLLIPRLLAAAKRRKAEKAAEKEERIELPDDDSPVEYI